LGRKISRAFTLAQEQLSNVVHYDFGLRTIKTVLVHAGQLKLRACKVKTNEVQDKEESIQMLKEYVSMIKPFTGHKRKPKRKTDIKRGQNVFIKSKKKVPFGKFRDDSD